MKILSITAQKPNATGSGVYLTELVRSWKAQGHTQAIVAGFAPDDAISQWEDIPVYPVQYESAALPYPVLGMSDEMPYPSTRYRDLTEAQLRQFSQTFYEVISRAIEQEKPDWICCHHLYLLTAMIRKWFPNQKIVGICHGSDLRQMIKTPMLSDLVRPGISCLDRIIALQEAQKNEILRLFSCPEDRISVLGAGYNPRIFYRADDACFAKKSCMQLIFAGKVTEKKGIFSLLRALDLLPFSEGELKVLICGGFGPAEEAERIRKMAAESRYPIEFTGSIPQTVLAQKMRESDVFILPSFFEGLPLVTIEAMACGCKVVCSDLPGVRQWYERHIPGAEAAFVKLPARRDADEISQDALPKFEQDLADAIREKLLQTEPEHPDLRAVSWDGVSRRLAQLLS